MIAPRRATAFVLLVLQAALSAVSCSRTESPPPISVVRPEAALEIEPPVVRAGDLAEIDIAVRTPPDHHLAPWHPPEVAALWLLEVESLPTIEKPGQWIHRLRVRVRPRELGILEWPATEVVVVDAENRETAVAVPGRTLEVVTGLATPSERIEPFGMLRPAPEASGWTAPGLFLAVVAGALMALAGQAGWRRLRGGDGSTEEPGTEPASPHDLFEWARRELDAASAELGSDPLGAASRAALTLRAFVSRRFKTRVLAQTTPELEDGDPPFAARSRWPYFLRVLRDLDDLRFRVRASEASAGEVGSRARAAVEESLRFIEETRPGGGRP